MSSINISKASSKHLCDKYISPNSNNTFDENDLSVPTNETNLHGNLYANTPSPSSIASTSTIVHRPLKSRLKNDLHLSMPLKRRYKHEKLFHYTHSLNRQYIITMTNILFQMQKEIYKLNKRTRRVEQILENQRLNNRPVIRIVRAAKDKTDEVTTNSTNNDHTEQNDIALVSDEIEHDNIPNQSSLTIDNINNDLSNERKDNIDDSNANELTNQMPKSIKKGVIKFCTECNYEFSHRSAYLRHMKNIHKLYFTDLTQISSVESDHNPPSTSTPITDQTENEQTNDSLQILINQWDVGEGRLRPRRGSKVTSTESRNKVQCDICQKYYHTTYIDKHKRRTHNPPKASSSYEENQQTNDTVFTPEKSIDDNPELFDNSPSTCTNTNPPSGIAIAEMDIDDLPIQFRKESAKAIVIASTCLKPDHIEIFEEFLQKFSHRVSHSPAVDSRTTHLITNDDEHTLRSPLSMKLIEGIANHCFCLSYRWVVDCVKYDRIIEEEPYEIESNDAPNHIQGGPKRSRTCEKRHVLFEKYCFMIKCTEDKDIRMTNDRLQDLIVTCGGRIINCVTQELLNQYEIVILCDRLYVSERRHNYNQCKDLGIHFVSSDWVLESILEYRPQSLDAYEEKPL